MQHIKRGTFTGKVIFVICIWCITAFTQLPNDTSFIKIDQGIHILQLKKDRNVLLFSLSFSECFHLYLKKAHSHEITCLQCAPSQIRLKFTNIYSVWQPNKHIHFFTSILSSSTFKKQFTCCIRLPIELLYLLLIKDNFLSYKVTCWISSTFCELQSLTDMYTLEHP